MLQHKHFLLSDLRWIIGNGQDVHILDDVWIPRMDSTLPLMPTSTINPSTVKDLILHTDRGNEWKRQIIHQLWPPDVAAKITVLPLGRSDISCWGSHPAGSCPFKAICQILQPRSVGPQKPWAKCGNLTSNLKSNSLLGKPSGTAFQLPVASSKWEKTFLSIVSSAMRTWKPLSIFSLNVMPLNQFGLYSPPPFLNQLALHLLSLGFGRLIPIIVDRASR